MVSLSFISLVLQARVPRMLGLLPARTRHWGWGWEGGRLWWVRCLLCLVAACLGPEPLNCPRSGVGAPLGTGAPGVLSSGRSFPSPACVGGPGRTGSTPCRMGGRGGCHTKSDQASDHKMGAWGTLLALVSLGEVGVGEGP